MKDQEINIGKGEEMSTIAVTKEVFDLVENLILEIESYHLDWDAMNSDSPDYDPDYEPKFPPIVAWATAVFKRFRLLP